MKAADQSGEALLRAEEIVKTFGRVKAVDHVSLSIHPGQIDALIGPNGAGKSTFMRTLTGEHRVDSGRIWIGATEVTGWAPHRISRRGVGRTYQAPRLFLSMSVLENLLVSPYPQLGDKAWATLVQRRAIRSEEELLHRRAREVMETVGLEGKANSLAGALSGGQQRLLELGRLLMTEAVVAVLDEPTAGLSPAMVSILEDTLRLLASRGLGILLVEHHMGIVSRIAARVSVMALGGIIASGSYNDVRLNGAVREAYLGVGG